jgi:hypothetical protein
VPVPEIGQGFLGYYVHGCIIAFCDFSARQANTSRQTPWVLHLQFMAPALMLFLLNRMASPMEKQEQRNRTRVTIFSVQ